MIYHWLYIDFNSYFASVEQQLHPALRGQPIAVVPVESDSTCAIAASYEAKAFGIKTGTPIYEAKKMCPKLICVVANHESYVEYHNRIIAEIDRHVPVAKVCSIDEVACELMDNESSQATDLAHRIKRGLAERVGECMRCSIGFAPNRYLAKVAADMQKPDGLTFLSLADLPHKLHPLKLTDLPGIGANMELRLKRLGIYTMETLCQLDLIQMRRAWGGVWGERMWHHLRGIELPDIETKRSSLGHSHVMAPELRLPSQARKVAIRLTLKAASRLRRMNYTASSFTLSLRTEEGLRYERSAKCWQASDSPTFIHLLERLWHSLLPEIASERIKKISVNFTQLQEQVTLQEELFNEAPDRAKAERASQALDAINQRYGRDSILFGLLPNEGRSFSGTKVAFTRIPEEEEFLE
jgi:DNA polymerase-4